MGTESSRVGYHADRACGRRTARAPNIVELVRYCREPRFATSLTTNGFLLTRKLV